MSTNTPHRTLSNLLENLFVWPVHLWRYCKFGYTFRRIYLGEGKFTILDQQDYYRLRHYKWIAQGKGNGTYAIRYKFICPNLTTILPIHREIMKPPEGRVIDHINCDSLDNRRANLRVATKAENSRNRRKKKNTSSQFTGVSFNKQQSKWESRIRPEGKKIMLGMFDNEIDAALAYDAAAVKYFGEFARLNFPKEDEKSIPPFTKIARRWAKFKSAVTCTFDSVKLKAKNSKP